MEIFKNVFFDEITSSDISISATILNYLSKLLDYEKKEWLVNDPYEYAKFCIHTMFVIRMLEKDIDQIELSQKERNIVEMIKKYKFKELVEPYEKNYVRFSVWKNRNGTRITSYNVCYTKLLRALVTEAHAPASSAARIRTKRRCDLH